ncbi:MAG TPA: cupredoxin domain-containing protein [Gaiellaceae bacterium]|nr:cupredoxin domain-containing protein [Gaiellaceae bacterium]
MRRLLLVAVAFLLPACGGEGDANEADAPAGGDVEIVLADFTVDPSSLELDPGSYVVRVVNEGGRTHALEVDGPTGEVETGDLAPGESADLSVDLSEPGEYEVYCPVDGHREQGMEGTITVGGTGTTPDETTTVDDPGYDY